MHATEPSSLEDALKRGRLKYHLQKYLNSCRPPPDADPKQVHGKFPNIAGFCRFMGFGISDFEALRISHPEAANYIRTVLEDEALNAHSLSPTLAAAYLKRRLGYADRDMGGGQAACGEMRLIFEHDIAEDGE